MPARKRGKPVRVSAGLHITSEQRHHYKRGPLGWIPKASHATLEDAWTAALREPGRMVAYPCDQCPAFHIGHDPGKRAQQLRADEIDRRAGRPTKAEREAAAVAAARAEARAAKKRLTVRTSTRNRRAAAELYRRKALELRTTEGRWLDDGGALHRGVDHER